VPVADLAVVDSHEALAAALRSAAVLFAWDFHTALIPRAWPHATKLRWVHTASIGVDSVMTTEVAKSDVVVSNTRGVFEAPIAEYVLAMLLLFARHLRETLRLQGRHEWSHRECALLRDQRTLICGAGPVARAIARRLRGIGADLDVVARSAGAGDPDFGKVHAANSLPGLLGRVDYLVVALPLTSETHGLFDRARLQQLKPGCAYPEHRSRTHHRRASVDRLPCLRARRRSSARCVYARASTAPPSLLGHGVGRRLAAHVRRRHRLDGSSGGRVPVEPRAVH
jgi:phosphoglycerate dehydrogenase-like enzyme